MQRMTMTIDDDLVAGIDAFMAETGALSRSEAIRDLVRRGLAARPQAPEKAPAFGVVSYVVDPSVRNLAARLPQGRLDRHDQTIAALSVPLDHSSALEVAVMRGAAGTVRAYAEALFCERGVMHGSLGLIPVLEEKHSHSHGGQGHVHTHLRVLPSF
ncbi:MAG: nickel-responsive transcriptional regulator NikR [Paenirhodobacter sp.]|uniref:nickel-responsive transcriptional regulator NikR n=1 Tax=Paenirhodobacter sp. TaxID=1965326 RepID=UPI003D136EDA